MLIRRMDQVILSCDSSDISRDLDKNRTNHSVP